MPVGAGAKPVSLVAAAAGDRCCVHTELRVGERNIVPLLESAAAFLDEPVSDPAAIPTFALAKLARESVTVVLTGEG